jgi:hypothetical protein
MLGWSLWVAERETIRRSLGPSTLLDGVSQLVGEEPPPGRGCRLVPAAAHDDMPANGVRAGMHRCRGAAGLLVGMDADGAEVLAEARFHEGPRGGIEGMAGGSQDLVHDRRRRSRYRAGTETSLLGLVAVAARPRWAGHAAAPLQPDR